MSVSSSARMGLAFLLQRPLRFSSDAASLLRDLLLFRENAEKSLRYDHLLSTVNAQPFSAAALKAENERLSALLEIKPMLSKGKAKVVYSRVIARSTAAWNKVLLIDKGFNEGLRINLPVFFEQSLVGKIVEAGPSVSKVLLITDPSCKIAVTIQRTRQQGILYGAGGGYCRAKYLSLGEVLRKGDRVETAGLGLFFPKGAAVGEVTRAWKEPGQIYQVAEVKPLAEMGLIEDVAVVET